MKSNIAFTFVFFAVALVAGCKEDNRPKDLPPLFPCTVIITQEGQPLGGAVINLVPGEGTAKYHPMSVTDDNGKVIMKTYGYDGVPAGRYKVRVWKNIVEGETQTTDSDGEPITSGGTEYRTVDVKYSSAETTPFEIEVTNKKAPDTTFDVGKPIKEKL